MFEFYWRQKQQQALAYYIENNQLHEGFIKSTNHRATDHRDHLITNRTDKILFKRLGNRKISILGKILNCTTVYYLLDE